MKKTSFRRISYEVVAFYLVSTRKKVYWVEEKRNRRLLWLVVAVAVVIHAVGGVMAFGFKSKAEETKERLAISLLTEEPDMFVERFLAAQADNLSEE